MSKRTKRKLKNTIVFIEKYILNGRYIVRNIFAVTLILIVVGSIMLVTGNGADEKTTDESVNISVIPVAVVDSSSISAVRAYLENEAQTAVVVQNETNIVADTTDEFATKFVCTEDEVNVRAEASTDSEVIGKLNNGNVGDIVSSDGEWLHISSGSVNGYVSAQFVLTGTEASEYAASYKCMIATVSEDCVRVRTLASIDSDVITEVYRNESYTVGNDSSQNEWICILLTDGTIGYISSDYVAISESYTTATKYEDDIIEQEDSSIDDEDVIDESIQEPEIAEEPQDTITETVPVVDNQTVVATTVRGAISLTAEDLNLMAAIVQAEAGCESYEGQLAVANVIINRIQAGSWGSTVSGVVYASSQFTVVGTSTFTNALTNGASATSVQAVADAVAGTNNIGGYLSFRPVRNVDTSTLGSYTIIGNHCFF